MFIHGSIQKTCPSGLIRSKNSELCNPALSLLHPVLLQSWFVQFLRQGQSRLLQESQNSKIVINPLIFLIKIRFLGRGVVLSTIFFAGYSFMQLRFSFSSARPRLSLFRPRVQNRVLQDKHGFSPFRVSIVLPDPLFHRCLYGAGTNR